MDILKDLQAKKNSGLSESEIARKSGVPQSTIWRLLNVEGAKPSYANIQKLWPYLYGETHPLHPLPSPLSTAFPSDPTQPHPDEAA